MNDPFGILPIDKPVGLTSHDVVDVIRRLYETKRVGHTGTLDPAASGLMLVVMGKATRVAQFLSGHDKTYFAGIHFGSVSDTGDSDGVITPTGNPVPSAERIGEIAAGFVDEIELPVPALASVRSEGKRRYELTRAGKDVPEMLRRSVIHTIDVLGDDVEMDSRLRGNDEQQELDSRLRGNVRVLGNDEALGNDGLIPTPPDHPSTPRKRESIFFRIRCSSGTYIRALAEAMGEKAGCGAYLASLRREAVGNARVEGAYGLDYLAACRALGEELPAPEAIDDYLELPVIEVSSDADTVIHHGQPLIPAMITRIVGEFVAGDTAAISVEGYGVAAIGRALVESKNIGPIGPIGPILSYQCVLI